MKFKYSIFTLFLKYTTIYILTVFIAFFVIYIFNGVIEMDKGLREGLLKSFIFYFGFTTVYIVEESRKYVVLFDEHIHFNSFRFKRLKLKRSSEFAVRYEDIYSLESVRIPLIGLWAVKIGAKNLPEKIRLSRNFRKENLMFTEIINRVKENNPNAYIDKKLTKYLDE